jgi:hypothetical protein
MGRVVGGNIFLEGKKAKGKVKDITRDKIFGGKSRAYDVSFGFKV